MQRSGETPALFKTPATVESRLRELYAAVNARDIDTALAGMTMDVDWPNGWEGGYVKGHEEIRLTGPANGRPWTRA